MDNRGSRYGSDGNAHDATLHIRMGGMEHGYDMTVGQERYPLGMTRLICYAGKKFCFRLIGRFFFLYWVQHCVAFALNMRGLVVDS